MKQKIQPGVMLDFLAPEEFTKHMSDFTDTILKNFGRHTFFKRVLAMQPVAADGSFRIEIVVPDGFVWGLSAFAVGASNNGGKSVRLYFNETSPVNIYNTVALAANTKSSFQSFLGGKGGLLLHAGEKIVIVPDDLTWAVGDMVAAQLYVTEAPRNYEADLFL